MDYLELPLTADATALSDVGKTYMTTGIPGWTARPGNVESILLEANGQIAAELVEQVAQVPPVIFAYFGDWLLGIALREATPATATVVFTFAAGATVTVPQGTILAAPNPDGSTYAFQTDAEVRSDATDFSTNVTALEAGAAANGCAGDCALIDTVADVAAVTMTGSGASGGTDEETGDEYLDRLADALTILAPRPILPGDFATMALQYPGVGRAIAIDLYQPSTAEGGYGAPRDGTSHTPIARCTTVAVTAEGGTAPTETLMRNVQAVLDAAREVNFYVYTIPPTYSPIHVKATVTRFPGYTNEQVQDAAEEMMSRWLDPNSWGSDDIGEQSGWTLQTKARIYEAVDYLNRAGGVNYVDSVQLSTNGTTWVSTDITLTGAAPLPQMGSVLITVNAPS